MLAAITLKHREVIKHTVKQKEPPFKSSPDPSCRTGRTVPVECILLDKNIYCAENGMQKATGPPLPNTYSAACAYGYHLHTLCRW